MIAVILAAGAGRRLGGVAKALLTVPGGNGTFLATIAASARAGGAHELMVVVAEPFASSIVPVAQSLGADVAHNSAPERGMASSVATGFAVALERAMSSVALLWPVDHPFVDGPTVARLYAALGAKRAVIPTASGRGGHPVVVSRTLWPELAACTDEPRGARTVFERHAPHIERVEIGARVRRDVDRPEDLARPVS